MKKLEVLRKANRYTRAQVAEYLGFGANRHMTVYNYETGKREPSFEILIKLAKLYNCTVNDFVDEQ